MIALIIDIYISQVRRSLGMTRSKHDYALLMIFNHILCLEGGHSAGSDWHGNGHSGAAHSWDWRLLSRRELGKEAEGGELLKT